MLKLSKIQITRIVAITLIVAGIAALVFWEGWGRQNILYMPVIVAAEDIKPGAKITEAMLAEISVPREIIIDGAFVKGDDEAAVIGKIAKQYIPAKAQLNGKVIYQDFAINKNEAIYYIPEGWIGSMSTSIRRGDMVEFWALGGAYKLGEYRVAFAKGADELEVTDPDDAIYVTGLERTGGTGVVTHVEIITTLKEYKKLYKFATGIEYTIGAENQTGDTIVIEKFLLVQKFR